MFCCVAIRIYFAPCKLVNKKKKGKLYVRESRKHALHLSHTMLTSDDITKSIHQLRLFIYILHSLSFGHFRFSNQFFLAFFLKLPYNNEMTAVLNHAMWYGRRFEAVRKCVDWTTFAKNKKNMQRRREQNKTVVSNYVVYK